MSVFLDFVSFWNEIHNSQSKYMKKIISIDYGTHKIGVAVSNDDRTIAFPKEVLINNWCDVRMVVKSIINLCEKYCSNIIIIGLPKQLNGKTTKNCDCVIEIANLLDKICASNNQNIAILLFDERFTTKATTSVLHTKTFVKNKKQMSVNYKICKNKTAKYDDARAACVLLNDVLQLEKNIS